jgi:hypothetical protein
VRTEQISEGQFVSLRGRTWLIEKSPHQHESLGACSLSCVDDDAQGEEIEVLLPTEVAGALLDEEAWSELGTRGGDDARAFAAYLRTIGWRTATAADRDLFQAPFRAGIRLVSTC